MDRCSVLGSESMNRGNYSICERDDSRKQCIIEASSANKVNIGTNISGTFMSEVKRSVAS